MNAVAAAVRYSVDASPRPSPPREDRAALQRGRIARVRALMQKADAAYGTPEADRIYTEALAVDERACLCEVAKRLIVSGDYAHGWALRAQPRLSWSRYTGTAAPPQWSGGPLDGTLLVAQEEGHGDHLMFARFLPQVKARGVRTVVAMTPMELARVMGRIAGVDATFPIRCAATGEHTTVQFPSRPDAWVHLNALPGLCGLQDVESVPRAPYVFADTANIEYWRPRVPQNGLRVGLVWRGGPMNDGPRNARSMDLATLAPLLGVPGVTFISLQKGDGEDEAREAERAGKLVHLGSAVQDFADTAAILAQIDLLISVDTSTANLAGAMGKPVWLLTRDPPEWRWAHDWYPTARRFPQHEPCDWAGAVADVAAALAALAQGATAAPATH